MSVPGRTAISIALALKIYSKYGTVSGNNLGDLARSIRLLPSAMKKFRILALVSWLIFTGGVCAQEAPLTDEGDSSPDASLEVTPPSTPSDGRDRICEQLRGDMTPEDLVALTDEAQLEISGESNVPGELILEWSDPETEEFFVVNFFQGAVTNISCSVRMQLSPRTIAEPREKTCEEFELGMSLEDLEEKIEEDRLDATQRRISGSEFLWTWENPDSLESIQAIVANGVVTDVSCSTLPRPMEP
ncbi:MAG: hypothetical protein SWY16_25265 [Cyanobacteriota bacterium]|nr:hypothetical protein [Cyanobacteriota bacterium]